MNEAIKAPRDELRVRLQPDFDKGKQLVDDLVKEAAVVSDSDRSKAVDSIATSLFHMMAIRGPSFAFAAAFAEAIMRLAEVERAKNETSVKE